MYHFYDVVINDKTGVPLGGVIVRVYDGTGSIIALYADEDGSVPIEAVSGFANAAVTDDAGNFDFYVSDGTYDMRFFVGDAVLKVLPSIQMVQAASISEILSILSGNATFAIPDEANGDPIPSPGSGQMYLSGGVLKIA